MLKLIKTGIGLLTKQYRSVLRKCLAINVGLFAITPLSALNVNAGVLCYSGNDVLYYGGTSCTSGTLIATLGTRSLSADSAAVAIGDSSREVGYASVSIGFNSAAPGWASVALGPSTTSAYASVAIGNEAQAIYNGSVALGYKSSLSENYVVSVGHSVGDMDYGGKAYSSNLFRRIVNVAEGSGANDAVTVSQLGNIAAGTKILNANGENAITFGTGSGQTTVGTAISTLANQLYNYYYTFRVDERVEAIEFAKELRSNKKEMSSLDFMPIKSSSDLRINLIKAEDPLTFSVKTRDDSLDLREVCHA